MERPSTIMDRITNNFPAGNGIFPMHWYPMRPSVALLEERLTVPLAPRAAEPRAPPERYRGLATRAGTLNEA